VLGIVPLSRICFTPKASLGFHQAYYEKVWTFGLKITSDAGTDELLSYYPRAPSYCCTNDRSIWSVAGFKHVIARLRHLVTDDAGVTLYSVPLLIDRV
jgi:hypothetical protein